MLAAVGCSSESLYFAKCQGGQAGGAGGAFNVSKGNYGRQSQRT